MPIFTVSQNNYVLSGSSAMGVEVTFRDKDGGLWNTSEGPQLNTKFEVLSSEDIKHSTTYFRKVKMRFNCALYDGDGNSLILKDAESVLLFSSS